MNLQYIAGLFDGEGTVQILHDKRGNNYCLRVCIRMTKIPALRKFKETLGGNLYTNGKTKTGKMVYDWSLNGKDGGELLKKMLPYLLVKGEQAKVAIKFQRIMNRTRFKRKSESQKREFAEMKAEIQRLNNL